LALLAEVCGRIRQPGEGLSAVTEALAVGAHTGQRHWDAELHRLKGTLMLQAELASAVPSPAVARDAESSFLEAIEIARRQRAKSLELRAATSFSRLRADQGKRAEAGALLSDIYGGVAEGLDTAGLRGGGVMLVEIL